MTVNNYEEDATLISQALAGDKLSLEQLIEKHQNWIFNVALNMTGDADDAADVTQEVLIKVITSLKSFQGRSAFRTWVYRIVKNHFLNEKRAKYQAQTLSFDEFGAGLDSIPDETLPDLSAEIDKDSLVQEAKLSCMKGMLLCLTPEQRMIYILGEMFEFPDVIGGEIMEISKANFRVKLHRTRTQLYSFMDNKCGLINQNNPCRCARKTSGFIKLGYVDPENLHFQKDVVSTIENTLESKTAVYQDDVLPAYKELYQNHPYLNSPEGLQSIRTLLSSESIKETFNFQ